MSAQFIVLEGPDGSGTTTHICLLADKLRENGKTVLETCEPTNGPIGRFIRESLKNGAMPAETLQLLFTADRSWHIEQTIKPNMDSYDYILSDRYWLSTVVYADATGADSSALLALNSSFLQPDQTIVLLPSFATCMERIGKRETADIMETDSIQAKVYEGYERLAGILHLHTVDTSGLADEVSALIYQLLPS